jgi:hypothetical protein
MLATASQGVACSGAFKLLSATDSLIEQHTPCNFARRCGSEGVLVLDKYGSTTVSIRAAQVRSAKSCAVHNCAAVTLTVEAH